MTLVLDKGGGGGPGVHALIIGVEDVKQEGGAPLHRAFSATEVARLFSTVAIANVPIASIDLLAGEPRLPPGARLEPPPISEPPRLEAVRSAIGGWRDRLDRHEHNLAFFFFVGPTLEYDEEVYLQLNGARKGRVGGKDCLSLSNLSGAMEGNRARRQLYFVDGCWSEPPGGVPDPIHLLHKPSQGPPAARATYVARLREGPVPADAKPVTSLAQAFLSVFRAEAHPVTAVDLAQQLRAGLKYANPSRPPEFQAGWNRDFALRSKIAEPASGQSTPEQPAPQQSAPQQPVPKKAAPKKAAPKKAASRSAPASEQPAPAPPPAEPREEEGSWIKAGDVLNHIFQVNRLLARGSRGEIFEGRNVNTGGKIAIKVLPPAVAHDQKVIARFGEEARALFKLDHPALVKYQELARDPKLDLLYIVTDFVEGPNLSTALGTLKPTPDALAELLRRLASGLGAAHAAGILHRDLSTANVILAGGDIGEATIIGFDIPGNRGRSARTIIENAVAGELNYAAPEQLGNFGREIGPWTDVYSLGLVILAVAWGWDLPRAPALRDTLDPRKRHDLSPVPRTLWPLLEAMLRPDPKDRLRSMDAVLKMLDEAQPDAPADAERPALDESMTGRVAELTVRQRECLALLHSGWSTARIAQRLGMGMRNVTSTLALATRTLGAADRKEAARLFHDHAHAVWPDEGAPGVASNTEAGAEAGAEADVGSVAPAPAPEPNTHFVSDDPEVERDELGRGPLAVALGRRLHRIWCRSNGVPMPGETVEAGGEDRAAFVLHLDAPWGGGKTSFANFLARVLNPFPAGCEGPAHFLAERAGGTDAVGTIFIDDPPAAGAADPAADWPEGGRRPWIVVPFNAWQAEHCAPPWWVFYQAIRKGCFRAVWAEGREASAAGQSTAPRRPSLARRIATWAGLWAREIGWRLRNPKIMALLGTAAVVGALILVLTLTGVIFSGGGGDGRAFNASDAFGSILIGVGGISGLWGLGALLTESVAPGTDTVAERKSLGGGDPFDRFRRHFGRIMKAVRRPVMVIVDDLDRCRPDFVVDLIRGIQTLLRSPRVVFVILGDRDWIERAFEAHHDAMKKVNVGAEQSFGARFVEKAIQMSFILPEMPETRQDGYVRRVLLGPGAAALGADAAPLPPADLSQQLRADYRETVASAETAEDRKEAEQLLRDKYQAEFQAAAQAGAEAAAPDAAPPAIPDAETAGAQADKLLGEERAMLAAVDERMGKALLHRLEPLARAFPANPRQIKRIVNAITMYTCVAYLQTDMGETDERGVELAIWVILMTEWPATWRLLAGCPDLLPSITAGKAADAKKALRAIDPILLPGSAEATLEEIMRVRADPRLRALIEGDAATGAPALTLASVREFRSLTPLYAGKRKLGAGPQSGETKH